MKVIRLANAAAIASAFLLLAAVWATPASAAQPVCPDGHPAPRVTPGPPLAPISPADVREIHIQTSVGGLGVGLHYDGTIVQHDGVFIGDASTEDVIAFLGVLQRPPVMEFDFSRTGYDRAYLLGHLDEAEGHLGDARTLPAARAAFEAAYFDLSGFAAWLPGRWFDPCSVATITDYYPRLSVTITTANRQVEIASHSQWPFMLPLWIVDDRGERPTYDPGLAIAIGHLLPRWAALHPILLDETAPLNWGASIARSQDVLTAIATTAVAPPRARQIARSMGISLAYDETGDGAGWHGAVWLPQLPRLRYSMGSTRSSEPAFAESLRKPKAALESLARARWLIDALDRTPDATVEIEDGTPFIRSTVSNLYKLDRIAAADHLAADVVTPTFITIRRGSDDVSRWWLLENGNLLLDDFIPGTTAFHFGRAWYDRIPLLEIGGAKTSGIIVSPDGAVLDAAK